MFLEIELRNFQKHHHQVVVTDTPITCITGPSDQGKSSIIRALRWVCHNTPAGSGFLRHGADRVGVAVVLADGQTVRRWRGKGGNHYSVGATKLAGFGAGVPDLVAQAVPLSPLNFQAQHDPPFWVTLSPGQLARELNGVVDMAAVDKVLASLRTRAAQASRGVGVAAATKANAAAEVEARAWAPRAAAQWVAVQAAQVEAEAKAKEATKLAELVSQVQALRAVAQSTSKVVAGWAVVQAAQQSAQAARKRAEALGGLLGRIQAGGPYVAKYRALVGAWGKVPPPPPQNETAVKLDRLVGAITNARAVADAAQAAHLAATKAEAEQQKKAKICPQCQRPL
jgi:hypothetical protein